MGIPDWSVTFPLIVCDIDEDEAGETFYGVYQLDGNKLYPKVDDDSYPPTSTVDTSDTEGTFTKQ